MTVDKLNEAIAFAAEKHADKTRKGSNLPYIVHPMEAAAIASYLTDDLEVIAAAVLHDVVEDSDATKDDLEKLFGNRVAELVASDSEDKMEEIAASASWKTRKQQTIDHLGNTSRDEQIIVLADKLSNIRSMYKDYCTIGDELWQRFNQKNKAEHAWYYKSIGEKLDKLNDTVPYHEYIDLVERVFSEKMSVVIEFDPLKFKRINYSLEKSYSKITIEQ